MQELRKIWGLVTLKGKASRSTKRQLCCGTGALIPALRPVCRTRLVGIDFSTGMLDVARGRAAEAPGNAAIDFVHGNVLDMPFGREFDLATCFGALGHILRRDEDRFVKAIAGVLKPGGRFVFPTVVRPSALSAQYWLSRGFNAAMHVRNVLVRPAFVMYYLRFLLPEVRPLLDRHGFDTTVQEGPFPPPLADLRLVVATRRD